MTWIQCPDCQRAREYPDLTTKLFNPACLWCGARYIQQLPGLVGGSKEREEKGRAHILRVWGAQGHDTAMMLEMSMRGEVPYQPLEDRRKR